MVAKAHAALCPQTLVSDGYQRHEPEQTALHRVLSQHWPPFVLRTEEAGGLPDFVKREIEGYLTCGLLEYGHARVACCRCGFERLVPFSCKGRICPSCSGRRMNDIAAHLVDRVLPSTPIRQWVCSFPFGLHTLLGYDKNLCTDVINAFVTEVNRFYKYQAKRTLGLDSISLAHPGSVTLIQRFDSALRLNVHAHVLALDGVYVHDSESVELKFHPLPELSYEHVADVATRTAKRIRKVLKKHGRFDENDCYVHNQQYLSEQQQTLLSCYQAAAQGRDLFSQNAPGPSLRLVTEQQQKQSKSADKHALVANIDGVSIHAATHVDGRDRKRLERLCQYICRPALAQDRIHIQNDGRVRYDMKRTWADGTKAFVLDPLDFIARLCALVPPPYFNLIRFHGVLAPHAKLRAEVVPKGPDVISQPQQLQMFTFDNITNLFDVPPANDLPAPKSKAGRHPWAQLLKRTFAVDILVCPNCSANMKLVEIATTPEAIQKSLAKAGLAPMPPPKPLPEVAGQLRLDFTQAS